MWRKTILTSINYWTVWRKKRLKKSKTTSLTYSNEFERNISPPNWFVVIFIFIKPHFFLRIHQSFLIMIIFRDLMLNNRETFWWFFKPSFLLLSQRKKSKNPKKSVIKKIWFFVFVSFFFIPPEIKIFSVLSFTFGMFVS